MYLNYRMARISLLFSWCTILFLSASCTSEKKVAAVDPGIIENAEPEDDIIAYNWPGCSGPEANTTVTLAEKADYFDLVARQQHIAGDGLMRNLYLTDDLQHIDHWIHVENVILWSGIYIASQAFRYAVTESPEALENTKIVVEALGKLTEVTGVSGLYGRSMDDPLKRYNELPSDHPGWTDSPVAGYEGWRYRNDVSKDGYDGLMFGYAVAMEHFDDETLLEEIRQRLREIADHIVGNNLQIFDADGIVTEHGRLFHSAIDDFPGFNALLSSSWIKIAAVELEDESLSDFYYGCLMDMKEGVGCPEIDVHDPYGLGSYIDSMENMLFLFQPDCKQNYDNFDMCYQAIYPLLRREKDDQLKRRLIEMMRNNMFHTADPRYQSIAYVGNSYFTFSYAALIGEGPDDDPVLRDAVDAAVCKLYEFPSVKFRRAIPLSSREEVCRSRLDNPCAAEPVPLSEYDFDNYLWRLDFFEMRDIAIAEDRSMVYSPEDFLLAYWMARYHKILSANQ
jgi:hypothetical protein